MSSYHDRKAETEAIAKAYIDLARAEGYDDDAIEAHLIKHGLVGPTSQSIAKALTAHAIAADASARYGGAVGPALGIAKEAVAKSMARPMLGSFGNNRADRLAKEPDVAPVRKSAEKTHEI